jgi:hypothetical protein
LIFTQVARDDKESRPVPGASGQHGGAAFTTIHWSVVLEAQASRRRHKKLLKNFAARIGDPFSLFCGDKGFRRQRQRISLRVFSRSSWSAEVSMLSERKKGDFVLICSGH